MEGGRKRRTDERPQEAEDKGKGHGRSPGDLLGAGPVAPGELRLSQRQRWPNGPRDCEPPRGIRGWRWGLSIISGTTKDSLPSFTSVGLRVAKGPRKQPKLESLGDVALERACPAPLHSSSPREKRLIISCSPRTGPGMLLLGKGRTLGLVVMLALHSGITLSSKSRATGSAPPGELGL